MASTPAVPHRRWSNRELARDLDRRRSRVDWRVLAAIVLALAPLGVYLQIQNSYVQLNYEMGRVQEELQQLEHEQLRLLARRAALEGPAVVERWADDYGLVLPTPADVVVVRRAASGRPDLVASVSAYDASPMRSSRGPAR